MVGLLLAVERGEDFYNLCERLVCSVENGIAPAVQISSVNDSEDALDELTTGTGEEGAGRTRVFDAVMLEDGAEWTRARFNLLAGCIAKPVQEYSNRAELNRAVIGVGDQDDLPGEPVVFQVFLDDAKV